jgi:hypothetical protein
MNAGRMGVLLRTIVVSTAVAGCSETMLSAHHTSPVDNSFWFTEVRDEFLKGGSATLWHCRLEGKNQDPTCRRASLVDCSGECTIKSESISVDLREPMTLATSSPSTESSPSAAGAAAPPPSAPAVAPPKSAEERAADKNRVGF